MTLFPLLDYSYYPLQFTNYGESIYPPRLPVDETQEFVDWLEDDEVTEVWEGMKVSSFVSSIPSNP